MKKYSVTLFMMVHLSASDYIVETRGSSALITYVKSAYEHSLHGIEYLVYPAKSPKRLLVLFNGATPGKYTMWSWFWRDDEAWYDTVYLFLKDDDVRWYLGSESNPKTDLYMDIITSVMYSFGLEPSQICTVGHSMGGYAALYYGLLLHAGCIYVFRPQVTWDAAATYYSVKKLKDVWVDIDALVRNGDVVPRLYLQYGEFMPDKLAGKALIDAYAEKHGIFIVERTEHPEHVGFHPTKEQIEATVNFLMNY